MTQATWYEVVPAQTGRHGMADTTGGYINAETSGLSTPKDREFHLAAHTAQHLHSHVATLCKGFK